MILLLDLLEIGAIFLGIMVITAKNPVLSVLFLILVFVDVACYLVLIGATYLGLVYLIVYVGAIAILFLFVIMMLNLRLVELVDTGEEYTQNLPMGAFLGSLYLGGFFSVLSGLNLANGFNNYFIGNNIDNSIYTVFNPYSYENTLTNFTQIQSIGQGLYTYASLWLILASIVFLLAMVGPIVLCMSPSK